MNECGGIVTKSRIQFAAVVRVLMKVKKLNECWEYNEKIHSKLEV
jgi:hypothetical protein